MRKNVDEAQRIREWEKLIDECKSRPKTMSMDAWCRQAGVSKSNYYYWSKKLGEGEQPVRDKDDEDNRVYPDIKPQIVRVPDALITDEELFSGSRLEISIGRFTVRITEDTSKEILRKVLEVVSDVE